MSVTNHRPWAVPPSAQFKPNLSDGERLLVERRKAELMRQLKIRKRA